MPRSKATLNPQGSGETSIRGAVLEPLRTVRRELVSPGGRIVVVDVPVYPPFRLESRDEASRKGGEEADTTHRGR